MEARKPVKEPKLYGTQEAADLLCVTTACMIEWDVRKFMSPSQLRLPGEPRRYSQNDIIAAAIAREARDKGIAPESVAEMVALIQRGDEDELRRAQVLTLQRRAGFAVFAFVREPSHPEALTDIGRLKSEGYKILAKARLFDVVKTQRESLFGKVNRA